MRALGTAYIAVEWLCLAQSLWRKRSVSVVKIVMSDDDSDSDNECSDSDDSLSHSLLVIAKAPTFLYYWLFRVTDVMGVRDVMAL